MSLSTKVGGVWKDTLSLHTKVGGVWKPARDLWIKVGGVWKLVWSALTAALDDDEYIGVFNQTFPGQTGIAQFNASVTSTGGSTYNWIIIGDYSSATGTTTSTVNVQLINTAPESQTGTIACEVSDGLGNTVTTEYAPWSLDIFGPP